MLIRLWNSKITIVLKKKTLKQLKIWDGGSN